VHLSTWGVSLVNHLWTRSDPYDLDAQYCRLRSESAVPIPDHVDAAKYAPILCAGVTVFNAMRRMQVSPGSLVAIQGLGGLGHLALQYANKFGFRVVALSRNADKEKFARDLGAHEYIDGSKGDQGEALKKMGGASLIVVTAPNPQVISPLMKGLGLMGKMVIVAGRFSWRLLGLLDLLQLP
jgi:D-arabinose 1-dehydrogenase-like Zn-dependent alcohol dehydrogenase